MSYYYDKQIKRYIAQFMAVFQGYQVMTGQREDGNPKAIDVPVVYGSKDRVSAAIVAQNTQNAPIRIPMMTAYLRDMTINPARIKGRNVEVRQTYLPQGGLLPDDITTIKRQMPVPYDLTMDLTMYVSNIEQHFQLLEQILVLFDPILQIQTNDAAFDWTKISIMELFNISLEENFPVDTNRRMIVTTLTIKLPIYLSLPANLKNNYVKDIYMRVGTVDDSSFDFIVEDLDGQQIPYTKVKSGDDLTLP